MNLDNTSSLNQRHGHARNVLERCCMKKSPDSVDKAYQVYELEHAQLQLPGSPLSRATFYRIWRDVPEGHKILKRKGKRAAREYNRAKLGRVHKQGFMQTAEVDAFHEPIKLLSSFDFTPLKRSPVHHFVVETETTVIMGMATNYQTGTERAEYSIDSVKSAFLPKTKVQEKYGTTHGWPVYGKTFEVPHDAGSAYNNANFDGFLSLCYTSAKLTRSKQPVEKPFVEGVNKIFKNQFTRPLEGSYDDNLPSDEQEKIIPMFTDLEHRVLKYRYVIDDYNQAVNKGSSLSRTSHWLREAQRQPPVLPANPKSIVNYLGVEDRKTIMEKVGIQVTVLGEEYIYNSKRLQTIGKKIKANISDKAKRRVFLKWSIAQPDFIMVRDPFTAEVFQVDRIVKDPDSEMVERQMRYGLPLMFYEMQNLEVLARMSNEEIYEHARLRRDALDRVIRAGYLNNASQAVALEAANERDRQHFSTVPQSDERHDSRATDNDDFAGFKPGPAEKPNWGSAI